MNILLFYSSNKLNQYGHARLKRNLFFFLTILFQWKNLYQTLCRKKTDVNETEPEKEKLKRVLNVVDLTLLGTSSTLGTGVYVLAGSVAKSIAGPAVVLSFILAAAVSSFSGTNSESNYIIMKKYCR